MFDAARPDVEAALKKVLEQFGEMGSSASGLPVQAPFVTLMHAVLSWSKGDRGQMETLIGTLLWAMPKIDGWLQGVEEVSLCSRGHTDPLETQHSGPCKTGNASRAMILYGKLEG